MIKFDKTFRISDTPHLNTCYTLCDNDKQCKIVAFGLDENRGNGTCMLSSFEADAKDLTLFEPRFNLYARKRDCHAIPQPGLGSTPFETAGTSWTSVTTAVNDKTQFTTSGEFPTTSPGTGPHSPGPTQSYPSSSSTTDNEYYGGNTQTQGQSGQPSTTSRYGSSSIDTNRYSTTERYPAGGSSRPAYGSSNPPSSSGYENQASNKPPTGYGTGYSTGHADARPGYYGGTGTAHGYDGYPNRAREPSSSGYGGHPNEIGGTHYPHPSQFPTYQYPMYYEKNYPMPNYPQNPASSPTAGSYPYQRPYQPSSGSSSSYPSNPPSNYPSQGGASAPSYPSSSGTSSGYGSKPSAAEPHKNGTSSGYANTSSSGNGYNVHEADQEKKLYLLCVVKPCGSSYDDYRSSSHESSIIIIEDAKTCFRRALAGKKVAGHYVRKTLVCERVADCQQECAEQRQFRCEGFNYRLDPTGRGQGTCELIEAPLSQIDLYGNGGANLMVHPDYDYYERDRSASPACYQPSHCIDCGSRRPSSTTSRPNDIYRPYPVPAPPSPPASYPQRPQPYPSNPQNSAPGYQRPGTAVDVYRPPSSNIYEHRPPLYPDRPQPHYPSHPAPHHEPARPQYGNIDRLGTDEPEYYRPNPANKPKEPIYYGYPGPAEGHGQDPMKAGGYPAPPPRQPFYPYLIGKGPEYGMYGGGFSHAGYYHKGPIDYWGIGGNKRKDGPYNYNSLAGPHGAMYGFGGQGNGYSYGGTAPAKGHYMGYPAAPAPIHTAGEGGYYGGGGHTAGGGHPAGGGSQWSRRPGVDDCSVKSSEGFRLHKGVVKTIMSVPNVRECEKMCASESEFKCQTYSYRYNPIARDNCLLCDRPFTHLDIYADVEPDRDFDIYSMSDDPKVCKPENYPSKDINAQCFFRSIDSSRFYTGVVRESITVKSIGECELQCLKTTKFTCRAFTFRYGPQALNSIPENCQLSDWPVREMDQKRHMMPDPSFDIYERASYGHGCEIRPMTDDKANKKLCYLGYGSPAKLLSSSIKKVISVPTELDCKNECARFRDTTSFKCLSFSYGSKATTFNCELSDLDQSELKLGINYAHVNDRDYWLFAWNPYDYSCRDKVATPNNNRVNSDRRIDVFKDPGELSWMHFTVTGKPCRLGSKCEKNLISGFYSCEIEGGEIGSWDYCCRTDHPCGYSQGFDYPWCFVGDSPDQWRKCSDRYFPTTVKPAPHLLNSLPSSKHQAPPKPGGFLHQAKEIIKEMPKLWPVTYFYSEGPPVNSTEMSNFIDCKQDIC
ncbi:uncharacterized protein LOC134828584 [Culicoides brevitarsis]|uniref:uncharacterized protein LOC134828584 n=1 Tax=Culicoides brevitarsis TaxID=469753 RepID=UPI00307B4E51